MLGGGFALATFIGRWRDTKDIDFYIHPRDRARAVSALTRAGFSDYFERLPYDRKWIHRSVRADVIVDLIWSMANQRAQVDDTWFSRAGEAKIRDQQLLVLPREEFMWCKLYILQRDHCDWTDVFNLLYERGPELDWQHLIARLEDDTPLLRALLTVYGWLCPRRVQLLPPSLWDALKMQPYRAATVRERPGRFRSTQTRRPGCERDRIRLLDTRDWFTALMPEGVPLAV
ncbi:MAG: hypothetical protein C5B50_17715 [Verrucomicrobia bacterium]|nr:MAG: hypothetical protein C5B50_17715 [Verrucomicrobiota bacterium]